MLFDVFIHVLLIGSFNIFNITQHQQSKLIQLQNSGHLVQFLYPVPGTCTVVCVWVFCFYWIFIVVVIFIVLLPVAIVKLILVLLVLLGVCSFTKRPHKTRLLQTDHDSKQF